MSSISSALQAGSTSSTAGQLGTGIDVAAFVNQILTADRSQETVWQNQQSVYKGQASALNAISANLSSFQTAVNNLNDIAGSLAQKTVSVSDPTVLNATADSTAVSGSHTILVNSLATTSSYYSAAQPTATTALQQGTFTLQVGTSAPVTITVDGTNNTLQGLASSINSQKVGVQAAVITDSQGARLSLVSSTSGQAGDLTVSSDSVGLGFTKASTGTDASLQVDGIPISAGSNTVTGVVPGLTLQLSSTSTTPTTILVSPDTGSAKQAVSDFVAAYNQTVNSISAQFQYNSSTKTAGLLAGDSTLQLVQQQLFSDISSSGTSGSPISTLASLGVNVQNDGTLTIDSAALDSALSANYSSVQSFFQDGTNGLATRLATTLNNLTDPTNGPISLEVTGLNNSSNQITQTINDFEAQLATKQTQLIAQYSQVNTTLQQLPLILSQLHAQLTGTA